MGHGLFFIGSSRKVVEANKGLGEAPKSCTREEHESATNSIARRGQGAIAPCRVKGQRPLWGLGQRPNSSTGDQYAKRAQQRRRQRSVPASNFACPQTRPQAALLTNSTLSRQMGATDQHGRRFSLDAGLFHCRRKTESVSYRNRKPRQPLDNRPCVLPGLLCSWKMCYACSNCELYSSA